MKIKYIWFLFIFIGFIACEDNKFETGGKESIPVVSGSADFSKYVAVGNSLTAGFSDGALFMATQNNSLPNILAESMALAGGGEFTQPITNDNIGGLLLGGNIIQNPRLIFDGSKPIVLPGGAPTTEISNILPGPFNNMGVPGAKSFHLLANGYGNIAGVAVGKANPYFVRMASSPNTSVIEDAMAQAPTFFSLWIGNNDVLSYALSGGSGVNRAGNFDPSTYGRNDITDPNVFAQVYSGLVGALTSGGAQGVVANIPDVTSLPHFTTIPYNPLDPTNPQFGPQIPILNATFAPLNQAFAYLGVPERSIVFSETAASPLVIYDESLQNITAQLFQVLLGAGLDMPTAGLLANQYGQSRQANEGDLLLLTSASVIATLNEEYFAQLVAAGVPQEKAGQLSINGITYPMRDQWVLLPSEQTEIKTATDSFNQTIAAVASQAGLAFVDANDLMQQLAGPGVSSNGFNLTADLVLGGAISLDGVHPTSRGYAMMANEFLKAIDDTYGSNFEEADALNDIGNYPVFYSPSLQ